MLCKRCENLIPPSWVRCPHCAEPGLFPNVRAAQDEVAELIQRYEQAARIANPGVLAAFVEEMSSSRAVLNRPLEEVIRLAVSDNHLYNSFEQQIESEARIPEGNYWDSIRSVAGERLFPNYKRDIRFAALALDDIGLDHYGDCSITLNTPMIAHRASVFHENSSSWADQHMGAPKLPKGYRAVWDDRTKLAVAKLGHQLVQGVGRGSFGRLVLKAGKDGNDELIEVHVWGPMTRRTFALVLVSRETYRSAANLVDGLAEKLAEASVPLGVRL